jgi:hypothetical protein
MSFHAGYLTAQSALESLCFKGGSTLKEIPYGKGRVFWAAYPMELAESNGPATELCKYVADRGGYATPTSQKYNPSVLPRKKTCGRRSKLAS